MLEREAELSVLADAVQAAATGRGSVVLVFGEAGIGKSSLVEALRARLPAEGRMFVGYCDDLATPRTLGPFRDLVGSVGAELSSAVTDGHDRDRLLSALRAELDWREHPAVLVIEDVHWADDATLDALRYLIRRIGDLPAVLVLTYRDDEVSREHALTGLLGQASRSDEVRRLPLRRLTADAVRELSADSAMNPAELFALTSGNPFFVAELLASARLLADGGADATPGTNPRASPRTNHGARTESKAGIKTATKTEGKPVPPSVTDAVLARVGRLDRAVQDVLEQLAVIPAALDRWLVNALADGMVPDVVAALSDAERNGLLTVSVRGVAFRHELTRRAIAGSVPAARLIALNQRALTVLAGREGTDVAQLVHHAAQAGDEDAIVRYGPVAARDAARAGAHSEAVAHFGLVLEHEGRFGAAEQARLLEEYGVECYTVGAADRAVDAMAHAVQLNRALGDPSILGASLRWLSRMHWWAGDRAGAEQAGAEAVEVLESAGSPRLLALALSNMSQLCMLAYHCAESIDFGERALVLARQAGDAGITSHTLTNIGTAQWIIGDPAAWSTLNEALQIALRAGEAEQACRAYVNLTWHLLGRYRLDEAEEYLTDAITLAEGVEQLGFLSYMHVEQARLAFSRGEWDEAVRLAELSLIAHAPTRCTALTVLAHIQVRRGHPDASRLLAEAWELAVSLDEVQRTGPAAAACAEDAWLRGDHAAIVEVARPVLDEAIRLGDPVTQAELGYWLTRVSGAPLDASPVPALTDRAAALPYGLQAAGRWREAADAWARAGCPYERAAALTGSRDPDQLLIALGILDELGARPLAAQVRARLRELGVARVPRGPLEETRGNPAGLTARQLNVLRLLGQGYTNAQIANQLVLSVRTVDSHVAAVLGKLGARDRYDAAARAAELGMLGARNR
jgi:DNA-binding CsgD family transcriptional regulator/tetratricopeptide (TPR) repeat protein